MMIFEDKQRRETWRQINNCERSTRKRQRLHDNVTRILAISKLNIYLES